MKRSTLLMLVTILFTLFIVWSLQPVTVTQAIAPKAITQLTNDHAVDVRPSWSPDNKMIAYQSNRDGGEEFHLYLMNVDGSNQHAITSGKTDDRHPVWTPDGKWLLYDSFDGSTRDIWMVNIADGTRKQVTHMGGLANFAVTSPDGKRLAFYLYKDQELNIFTSLPDGTDVKQVTSKLASAQNGQCTFACHQIAWSADGKTIAYSGGEHQTIWTANSDGTNAKRIVANSDHNHFPWFLPDGRLGYISEHVQPSDKAWTDAWAYDFGTGNSSLLQGEMSVQGPFEWSNDGTRVLFHSPRGGTFDIYMIDLTAPGGENALKGLPVSPDQMSEANPVTASAPSGLSTPVSIGILAGIGLVAAAVVIGGVIVMRRRRSG